MDNSPIRHNQNYVQSLIFTVRGQRVILDADLARIYGITTKALNQAVKRNLDRFPRDFMFPLTPKEKAEVVTICDHLARLKFSPVPPNAFTEHGAIMAANVVKSSEAVRMSIFVVRAFIRMRQELISRTEMEKRLLQVENILLAHDDRIREIYEKIRPLLLPPPRPPRKPIGFHVRESGTTYGVKGKSRRGNRSVGRTKEGH
jgi:hypothetical protein